MQGLPEKKILPEGRAKEEREVEIFFDHGEQTLSRDTQRQKLLGAPLFGVAIT
jgi:hypothetical protein